MSKESDSAISRGNVIGVAIACAIVIVLLAYPLAYITLCDTISSASLNSAAYRQISFEGRPFLNRYYPNGLSAMFFTPAARLETWLTGVEVTSIDKSQIEYDFTIDDSYIPPPGTLPPQVGLDPNGQVYESQTSDPMH